MNNIKFNIELEDETWCNIYFGPCILCITYDDDGSYEEDGVCITTEGSEYYTMRNLNMKMIRKCVKFFKLKKELFFDEN